MRSILIITTSLLVWPVVCPAGGKDPRLQKVSTIFVEGNSEAAENARRLLRKGKSCLVLADRAGSADAVLEIAERSQVIPVQVERPDAPRGLRHRGQVRGTLAIGGGQIWSYTETFSGASALSVGAATNSLLNELVKDAGCRERRKPRPE